MRDDEGRPRYRLKISLWLRHEEPRDLGEMLRRFGLSPGAEWMKGDPARSRSGKELGWPRPQSHAAVRLEVPPSGEIEEALREIVARLEPVRPDLQAFADDGGRACLVVGWFPDANSDGILDWRLMRDLAELRLDIAMDIYPPDRVDELDSDRTDGAVA